MGVVESGDIGLLRLEVRQAEVLPQIEGKEHDPVRRCANGRARGLEVGEAVLVLAMISPSIRAALQVRRAQASTTRRYGPVQSATREGPDLAWSMTIRIR